jgi:GTP-binding protein
MAVNSEKMRNVAIIAHVDHGKTTLVDALLKQAGSFKATEDDGSGERVMDSDAIERERGITIFSKNCAVDWKGVHVNIVDTPGHADFGGQVERVLGTVDGVLLIVDAWEGPMAQTRFVTKKALAMGLKPIVVINKIDRDGCQPAKAVDAVFDLFVELEAEEWQLDFPVVYASGRSGITRIEADSPDQDMGYLLDMIVEHIPNHPGSVDADVLMQISTLEYSDFLGRLAVGRLKSGTLKTNQTVSQSHADGSITKVRVQKVMHYEGVELKPTDEAVAGEIVAVAGLPSFDIGDTISAAERPQVLERITIDPPTISMTFSINDSPLVGKYGGKFLTGNHLQDRLDRAKMADPALRTEKSDERAGAFRVSGRGVMHLTILIENMRREGYEFSVGAPEVLYQRDEKNQLLEPFEVLKVEVPQEYQGGIIEELGKRKAEMRGMEPGEGTTMRLEYLIPARGLIGLRTVMLSLSRGYAVMQTLFEGFYPYCGDIPRRSNGAIIAKDPGESVAYALWKLEDRGSFFIPPGEEVYEGMIIGQSNRDDDLVVNCLKGKQLTNMRTSGSDDNILLTPYKQMSLEEAITFINDDELVEITPEKLRLRKLILGETQRRASQRRG